MHIFLNLDFNEMFDIKGLTQYMKATVAKTKAMPEARAWAPLNVKDPNSNLISSTVIGSAE